MVFATEPRVGGGRAKTSVFLKYLNLNSKFSILDNFPNDVSIFPTTSKKHQSKDSSQKKVSGGGGICTPPPSFSSFEYFSLSWISHAVCLTAVEG